MKNSEASESPQSPLPNKTVTSLAIVCVLLVGAVIALSVLAFGKSDAKSDLLRIPVKSNTYSNRNRTLIPIHFER